MQDLDDALHIDQQQGDLEIYTTELRREPTTESLRALVNQAIVFVPHGEDLRTLKRIDQNKRCRILRSSRRLILESKPQAFKDEEDDTKKILHERAFQLKERQALQRQEGKLPASASTPISLHQSPSPLSSVSPVNPGKRVTGKMRDVIKAQIDTMKLEFGNSGYNDVPCAKSEDWFRIGNSDCALDLVLKVQGQALPSETKPVQKPLNFLEKGVDSLGQKLGSIKRSGTFIGSPNSSQKPHKTSISSPVVNALKLKNSLRGFGSPSASASASSSHPPAILTTAASPNLNEGNLELSSPFTYIPSRASSLSLDDRPTRAPSLDVPAAILERDEPSPSSLHTASESVPAASTAQTTPATLTYATVSHTRSRMAERDQVVSQIDHPQDRPASQSNHTPDRRRLSIVTTDLPILVTDTNRIAQDLYASRLSSLEVIRNMEHEVFAGKLHPSMASMTQDEYPMSTIQPHQKSYGYLTESPLDQALSFSRTNLAPHSRANTVGSSISAISGHTSQSASISNVGSSASSQIETVITPPDEGQVNSTRGTNSDRKGKSHMRYHKLKSISHSPLLTNRVIDFGTRHFSRHFNGAPGSTPRPKRKLNPKYEEDILNVFRQALEDDSPALSPANSMTHDTPRSKSVKFETDVLIQNEGGFIFFGHEKFNERFRSKPWQTIKMVKRYERPGDWDSGYIDDSPQAKLVQTPYTPSTFPLPTPQWSWVTDFEVDYRGRSVDANGWEYFDIYSHQWKGRANGLKTFSRRRRWVRTRIKDSFKLKNELLKLDEGNDHFEPCIVPELQAYNFSGGAHSLPMGGIPNQLPSMPSSPSIVLKLSRIDGNQNAKLTHSNGLNGPSQLPRDLPFSLVCEGGELDFYNPFFSYKKLVLDFQQLMKRENPQLTFSSLSTPTPMGLGLASNTSPEVGVTLWIEEDFMTQIGGPWKDKLAAINLNRVMKVLVDFSEHQKLKIWRCWLGIDTFEQDGKIDRPDPQDVWQVIENHLEEVLQLFIYQNSRYRFLYLISLWHHQSFAHPKSSNNDQQSSTCITPTTCSRMHNRRGVEKTENNTQTTGSEGSRKATQEAKLIEAIVLHSLSKFSFWSDVSNLLNTFNWKLNEEIDSRSQVARQIRTGLNRLVKSNLKRWHHKQGR